MTLIIGHRAVGAKETTLGDFQAAIDLGLEMVEFDLRLTGDRQLVVFHGPPGMEGRPILAGKSYLEICRERALLPPLFSDVVDLCAGRIRFDIEIKEEGILSLIRDQLRNRDDHIITSFLDPVVAEARKSGMRAGLVLGMAGISLSQRVSEYLPARRKARCRADFLVPEYRIFKRSPQREALYGSLVWGVNLPGQMRELLLDPTVDGIITDEPELARTCLHKQDSTTKKSGPGKDQLGTDQ